MQYGRKSGPVFRSVEGFHLKKGYGHAIGLSNWLARNPTASFGDHLVAQSLFDELAQLLR